MEPFLKRILPIIIGLLLALIAGGCQGERAAGSRPLLKVNERQVSKAEFDTAFARTLKPGQTLSPGERLDLERAFLTQLIDRELSLAEARRRGIAVSPAELAAVLDEHRRDYPAGGFEAMLKERGLTLEAWQAELSEKLTLDKLTDQLVGEHGRIGDMEIDAYYAAHRGDFDRPPQVRVRQIVVADPALGERILAQLRKGESFAALAKRESLSPEAANGGDLGFFGRDEMPPEFDVVFALPMGKVSPLVKSEYGYHLFLVEEKRPAARLGRQEAAREIRALLEAERRETVYREWLQALRGKATVKVDWRQLEVEQQESK
jgi:peptidyl-prolyl cis-trans isomerase C